MGKNDYMAHNKDVIRKGVTLHAKFIESKLVEVLKGVADAMLSDIENGNIPIYSGNLKDATGVGVYENGVLVYMAVPNKTAKRKQSSGFHYRNEYNIDGSEYLSKALTEGATSFAKGVWIVIFSAVPYAYFINYSYLVGNLSNVEPYYFSKLTRVLIKEAMNGLIPITDGEISISTN